MDLVQRNIASTVAHQLRQVAVIHGSKPAEEPKPTRQPEDCAQQAMNMLGVDVIEQTSQGHVRRHAVDAEQRSRTAAMTGSSWLASSNLSIDGISKNEHCHDAHQAMTSTMDVRTIAFVGADTSEHGIGAFKQPGDDRLVWTLLGHKRLRQALI